MRVQSDIRIPPEPLPRIVKAAALAAPEHAGLCNISITLGKTFLATVCRDAFKGQPEPHRVDVSVPASMPEGWDVALVGTLARGLAKVAGLADVEELVTQAVARYRER